MKFFLDTYALIEIVKGNQNYKRFLDEDLYTTVLNLYELYYNLLKDFDKENAREMFYKFYSYIIQIKDNWIFLASEFKLKNKKSNISYTDALGYVIAKENEMKFLTGDKEFKALDDVEFVK